MILSKKCEYAIRALVYLAGSHRAARAREISERQKVPYSFANKVLQELKAKGFVTSTRGPKGGFALAAPPTAIRLRDVLTAIEGDAVLTGCLYGLSSCSDENPCPLHEGWKDVRGRIEAALFNNTLADLVAPTSPDR